MALRYGINVDTNVPLPLRHRGLARAEGWSAMMRSLATVALLGWILWFTQEESRPHLNLPTHWNVLGWFDSEGGCQRTGQGLIDQLGRVAPITGYRRATAVMAFLDTSQ